ncbi:ArsR/SmtB family transcription factor [Nocardia grenadensis]|uniref:ArsR/SmtB family transcription factor n=1 Tax=Nocardia grenadensis TaxID=931537 RepID=UPI003D76448F
MAKYLESLDGVFAALSDPSRRAVVQRLGAGPASVGELARDLPITLPSFMKHLRVLENSGLIRTIKTGRVRRCELDRDRFALIDGWLAEQRQVWEARTDRLEQFLLTTEESTDES